MKIINRVECSFTSALAGRHESHGVANVDVLVDGSRMLCRINADGTEGALGQGPHMVGFATAIALRDALIRATAKIDTTLAPCVERAT